MNPTWLYVAAVYAVAVWLARRAGIDLPWRIAAFFYVLALLFLFPTMTGPYVGVPVDFLRTLPPWSRYTPRNGNFELNDLPMQIVPWAHQVRESWKHFEAPLWNARAGSGYPLLANGQSSALSIIRILALPLPLGQALTAEAAMKILIALTFMFLLCRKRGYGEIPSSIAAAGFAFGTFMTVWLHFPLATVACLLPAALYAVDLLAERVTWGRVIFAAFVWVAILFGGHPETAAHIFFMALLWVGWILAVERPLDRKAALRFFFALCSALVVAALLASPFLATFGEGLTKSKRFQQLKAHQNPAGIELEWPIVVALFEPHFYGDVPVEKPWGPAHPELVTAFTGILGLAASIGLLLSAIATRRFRTREFLYVVATFIVLGILLDWPIVGALFHKVLAIAANGRLRLVLGFLFALQAAAAVELLTRSATASRAERLRVTIPLLTGLALVSLAFFGLMRPSQFDTPWHITSSALALMPGMAVLALASIAVVVAGRTRTVVLMFLTVAVIAEVWSTGIDWNSPVPQREMFPTTPLIRKLQALRDETPRNAPFRVTGIDAMFFPNPNAVYGLDDIRVHDPMANGRYLGVLRVVAGYDPSDYFAKWENIDSPLLDYLNVRYVAVYPPGTEVKDRQRFGLVYQGPDGAVYENRDVLPRFFVTPAVVLDFDENRFAHRLVHHPGWGGTAVLRRLQVHSDKERSDLLSPRPPGAPEARLQIDEAGDSRYRLHVDAPRYTMVVSSIPIWPGWHVSANGRRIDPIEVNGAFLGFVLPPGASDVRVWFAPRSFQIASAVSLLTLAAIVALSRKSLRARLRAAALPG